MNRHEQELPYVEISPEDIEADKKLSAFITEHRTTNVFALSGFEGVLFLNRIPDIGLPGGYFYDQKAGQAVEFDDGYEAFTFFDNDSFKSRLEQLRIARQKAE